MIDTHEIEIILDHHIYLRGMSQSWKSHDLHLTFDYDHLDQIIFSAYSPHIEGLKTKKELNKRLISLNILLNGAIFVSSKMTPPSIKFSNYHIENKELGIEPNNGMSLWSDSIEEYPFLHNEEYYKNNPKIKLPSTFNATLFNISKIDFVIRTLLFQAGVISNNSFTDKILTWNTLYKIVDTIRYGSKEIDITLESLINLKDLERFTSACNNPVVLGINARHGGHAKKPKRITPIIDLEEAISLILCFANQFSRYYIVAKGYVKMDNSDLSQCMHRKK